MNAAWLYGLAGGALIGASAAVLFWVNGRIAGVSGIVAGAFTQSGQEAAWRWTWVIALLLGGAVAALAGAGLEFIPRDGFPVWAIVTAGILVGFGTRYGSGCTSGHGICGMARLSTRSIFATVVFMLAGATTVYIVRHVLEVGV